VVETVWKTMKDDIAKAFEESIQAKEAFLKDNLGALVTVIDVIADSLDECVVELEEWMILRDWVDTVTPYLKPGQPLDPPNWALPSKFRPQDTR